MASLLASSHFAAEGVSGPIPARAPLDRNVMTTPTAALMLKAPIEGLVKTRLARSVGAAEATRIYRCLVEHQLAHIPRLWPTHIHFTPLDGEAEMRNWLGPAHTYSAQADGDLGQRLAFAMR